MKNKLILLVSMLLPLVSSCGEKPAIEPTIEPTQQPTVEPTIEPTVEPTVEPTPEIVYNYKESEYSEILNSLKCSKNFFGEPLSETSYINEDIHKKDHSIIQYSGDKCSDYYLCAYIYHDDLELMKSYIYGNNPPIYALASSISYPVNSFNILRGVDGSFVMMNHFLNDYNVKNKYSDYVFKDIIWYEIPSNEEIPATIGEYDLSLISQLYYFDYYDLDRNFLGQKPYLMECRNHKTYLDLNAHPESLIKRNQNTIKDIEKREFYLLSETYKPEPEFMDVLYKSPFSTIKIKLIDDIEYIFIGKETVNAIASNKYELIKMNDYEYYIKLEDIIDYIKTSVY